MSQIALRNEAYLLRGLQIVLLGTEYQRYILPRVLLIICPVFTALINSSLHGKPLDRLPIALQQTSLSLQKCT